MREKRSPYRVVDLLEVCVVDYCQTDKMADKVANDFFYDTDGECNLIIEKFNPATGRYEFLRGLELNDDLFQ